MTSARRIAPCLALCLSLLVLAAGCAVDSPPSAANSPNIGALRERNQGYSLLFNLMSQEAEVSGILVLKKIDPTVSDLVRQVAKTAADAKQQLETWKQHDPTIDLKAPELPVAETDTRNLIAKSQTDRLLGSNGPEFATRLLFTQAQAMDYAAHLAKSNADREPDPQRKQFLQKLSAQCADYQKQLMDRLTVK